MISDLITVDIECVKLNRVQALLEDIRQCARAVSVLFEESRDRAERLIVNFEGAGKQGQSNENAPDDSKHGVDWAPH